MVSALSWYVILSYWPQGPHVSKNQVAVLGNGCAELDWITGTGDLVGALTAVFSAKERLPLKLLS